MTILEKANQILADKEANLLPENLRQGITCLGVDGTLIELVGEEKSVIATTEEQEITPAEGYNGITKIVVRPVTNAIDASIKAENIKKGITILGVEGSYKGEILIWPTIESLPANANVEDLGIVVTPEHYINSTYETEFGTRVYLPDQITFETNPGELTGYIGIVPEDETIIDSITGSLTTALYTFNISLNGGVDVLEVVYTSEDGLTYIKSSVTGTGIFQYNTDTKILTSTVEMFPHTEESLVEMYDTVGGLFLQQVIDPAFAGVYEFADTGWVRIDLDTSDGNATETDIVTGKSAYVNGEKIEGTISEIPAEQANMAGNETQSNFANVPLIKEVYSNDVGETFVRINYVKDTLQRAGSALMVDAPALAEVIGLTADKIKAGETILGIEGTYTGETTTEPEEEEPTVEPVTISVGKTYNVTFADTIAEDIDLVEQATNNDLTIINDTETNMIYCASAYLIGFVTVTDTGTEAYQYMDANVIAKLQELAGTENVTVNGTTDRGWKHVVMADGVYTISDTTTPEPVQMTVGTLNYEGATHDTLDVTAFNWLMTSVEEVVVEDTTDGDGTTEGGAGADTGEITGGEEELIPDEGEM